MSPIPSLRNRHQASGGSTTAAAGGRNNSSTSVGHHNKVIGPPSLRFVRRGPTQHHHHHHHHHHSCSNQPKHFWSNSKPSTGRCCRKTANAMSSTRPAGAGAGHSNHQNRSDTTKKNTSSNRLLCGIYSLPKIKDVNLIDKYSRIVFPATFAIFNVVYWSIYILL